MPRLSRRVLIAGGGALALVATPLVMVAGALARPEAVIIAYLRRQLPGLAVPDAQMQAFARTHYQIAVRARPDRTRGALAVMNADFVLPIMPIGPRALYDRWARQLLTAFLLSTDFFTEAGQDPERTKYVAYSDPWELGCRNPLMGLA